MPADVAFLVRHDQILACDGEMPPGLECFFYVPGPAKRSEAIEGTICKLPARQHSISFQGNHRLYPFFHPGNDRTVDGAEERQAFRFPLGEAEAEFFPLHLQGSTVYLVLGGMIGIDPQDQEVGAVDLYVGESPRHRIVVADYYAGSSRQGCPRGMHPGCIQMAKVPDSRHGKSQMGIVRQQGFAILASGNDPVVAPPLRRA